MRAAYDFSPLYASMIGADRMAERLEATAQRSADAAWPPYDIEKTAEDSYRITIAPAGFRPDELEIIAQPNLLVVAGRKTESESGRNFLHHGLSARRFERRFELADFVIVQSATYADGLLAIDLAREIPEALKPRRVEISAAGAQPAQLQPEDITRHAA